MNFKPNNFTIVSGKISGFGLDAVRRQGGNETIMRRSLILGGVKYGVTSLDDFNSDDKVILAVDKDAFVVAYYNETKAEGTTLGLGTWLRKTNLPIWSALLVILFFALGRSDLANIPQEYHLFTYLGIVVLLMAIVVDVITDYRGVAAAVRGIALRKQNL